MKSCWNTALGASLLFHLIILIGAPSIFDKKTHQIKGIKNKEVQIIYENIEKIKTSKTKSRFKDANEPKPPPYIKNIMSKLIDNKKVLNLEKTQPIENDAKKIIFSQILKTNKELNKNPAYMDYYKLIREKIRTNIQNNYDNTTQGEVLVNFLVRNDGSLGSVDLNSKPLSTEILENVVLKSIQNANPFPSFPKELKKYSYLQFNISVYFKKKIIRFILSRKYFINPNPGCFSGKICPNTGAVDRK